jgi:hypothetical protein
MWGSQKCRAYLSGVGIDVERVLSTSDALLPIQLLLINSLLDFNDPKPDHKKIKELGISSRTYSAWRRDPAFLSYLKKRVEGIVGEDDDEISRSLFERARDGDITAIKFYYEITGKYRPQSAGQQQDFRYLILRVQEVLLRNLQGYPELMQKIGLELENISNEVVVHADIAETKVIKGQLLP